MTLDEALRALWRQKMTVVLTVVAAVAVTYVVSSALPKVYVSKATLFVKDSGEAANDFEAIQSAQVLAKTYAELIQSDNLAGQVAARTPGDESGAEVLERVTFEPLPDTQLLVITAEGDTAELAQRLANTYASQFVAYTSEDELGQEIEGSATIADPATVPDSYVRPRPKLYAAVAGLMGLFLGCGLALLRDRLDTRSVTRIGSPEELSAELGVPVLTQLPRAEKRRPLLSPMQQESFVEGVRVLYANLRFVSSGQYPESLLITSPGVGDGKSTVCLALASVFAEHGGDVAVVEGDMRRPGLPSDPDRPGVARGLSAVLAEQTVTEQELELIATHPLPGVVVLPAGPPAENPSALLQAETVAGLLDSARKLADTVIIDSPPVVVGPDAMLLSRPAQATLLVVNQRNTTRAEAVAAMRQLRQAGANVVGVAINEVPPTDHGYYSSDRDRALAGRRPATARARRTD